MDQKKIERTGLIALSGIGIFLIILIIGGIIVISLGWGGSGEELVFLQADTVPENAVIIKLTEEDYEKYPVLKDIPESVYLDTSPLSELFDITGLINRETGYAIIESYGYVTGDRNRYIEHNGVIYEVGLYVS
ncbi:MAG: hypothetical protein IJA20_00865 [Methanocorpusculum sp.]|nr:hypothetical protein [Methanocorpusculum sp.]